MATAKMFDFELETIARRANDHWRQYEDASRTVSSAQAARDQHYLECGRALLTFKSQCPRGQYEKEFKKFFQFDISTARRLMAHARHIDGIEDEHVQNTLRGQGKERGLTLEERRAKNKQRERDVRTSARAQPSEAESDRAHVPGPAESAPCKHCARMRAEMDEMKQRAEFWNSELERDRKFADEVIKARKGVMPPETFNLIWSCLHPDSRRGVSDERLAEAFRVFGDMKPLLLSQAEAPWRVALPLTPWSIRSMRKK